MSDFVAALAATALFCTGVLVFNALTRLALRMAWMPADLSENGFLQFGLALALSVALFRKASRRSVI